MKRLSLFIALAVLLVQSCRDEEVKPLPENEQSAISDARDADAARRRCALTMDVILSRDSVDFTLTFQGTGSITIDWGDGTSETHTLPGDDIYYEIHHYYYTGQLLHTATLSGDLQNIKQFSSHNYESGITDLYGMECLPALKHFYPSWFYDGALDLSKNRKLKSVNLYFVDVSEGIRLPHRHYIDNFVLNPTESAPVTQAQVDYIIGNIHHNAVTRNLTNGYFEIVNTAVPSDASFDKLRSLRDDYGWYVFVDDLPF